MNKMKGYKLTKDMVPSSPTHPGLLIFDEIEYRNIKQKDLADAMHIAPTVLSEIIHGKRNLTALLALKLEKALDIDANTWMRLQVKYDIDSIRIKQREKKAYHSDTIVALASEPKTVYAKSKRVTKRK